MLAGRRILLIVSGGIAAYKALELIRLIRGAGGAVRCVLTRGGDRFVTPLSLGALSEDKVYTDLFSLTDEAEMGHIRLSREADLVVVAPASADLIARMAHGLADDLASTVLLATDKPVMIAPAMNVRMWEHPATEANIRTLERRGVSRIGPDEGAMACNEYGMGRLAEPDAILAAIIGALTADRPLAGRRALVTAGPTVEPIDPVRFLSNRSSGKQGYAIAAALAAAGARVRLISGPVALADPPGVETVRIETAEQMDEAAQRTLRDARPDIAICAAAVSDWRAEQPQAGKIKKTGAAPPSLLLTENPDILAGIAGAGADRPALVIGFAAETGDTLTHAEAKRSRKGCDWILANDVGIDKEIFGGDHNTVHVLDGSGMETWEKLPKTEIASRLVAKISRYFALQG